MIEDKNRLKKNNQNNKKIIIFSRKRNFYKSLIFFSILFFNSLLPLFSQETVEEVTVIRITNAKHTNYRKDEKTNNDVIELEGSVQLTVEKGNNISKINADKIIYDRKTEMLSAQGNVTIITKSSSSGEERTSSNSLLLNTSTLEAVFEDGRVVQTQSDAINLPSGSTLVVFSDLFGKTEANTIAFKNSRLTFCDAENPHWYIDASRTWLLPGGEFAFFNAFLFVGPIPVLYFPAFYYPKDELLFNPVFGIDKRRGFYVQTTSYILGRKNLEDNSDNYSGDSDSEESLRAIYNFMKPTSLKKQERQGLVLHNLDEDFEGDTSQFLKVKADWYTNLGALIGLEGAFAPSKKYLTDFDFLLDIGLSRSIFLQENDKYSIFSTKGNSYWDKSNFLGLNLPFRYGGKLNLTLSNPIKINLNFPFYSDPYFYYDYGNRSESMDWISFFLNGMGDDEDDDIETVSSYVWKLNTSFSPKLPDILKPYISNLSFTLNSSVNISSTSNKKLSIDDRAKNADGWMSVTPERSFYYPSQFIPASLSFSMNGTLFQYPRKDYSSKKVAFDIPLNVPQELKSQKELQKEKEELEKAALEKEEKAGLDSSENQTEESPVDEKVLALENQSENEMDLMENEEESPKLLFLPELSTKVPTIDDKESFSYNLTYQIKTSLSTQFIYDAAILESPQDFDWTNVKSFMYTLKAPLSITSNMNYGGDFLSMTNQLSYDPIWQDHPNTDGYTDDKSLLLADLKSEKQEIYSNNKILFRPFSYIPAIKDTGITYNTSMKIFRREFIGDSIDDPEYEYNWIDFEDSDSITSHNLDFTFSTNQFNSKFKQTFTYSMTLSPQLPKYSFSLKLDFPYVTSSFSYSFQETSLTDDTIKYNPLQQSLSLSLFDSKLRLTESYNLNINEWDERKKGNHSDSLKLSANWNSLSLAYVMTYTYGYDFDNGWKIKSEKEFLPYTLSLSYSPSVKTFYRWSDNLSVSPGLSTSINADLIRPTNSYFNFSPRLTFKITDFVDISFSSTSRNSILYWYFNENLYDEGIFGLDFFPFNMILDLINSFRFDNRKLREASGFKIKNLVLSVNHHLHDWKLSMSLKIEPRVSGNKISYDPFFSIGISWNPMESIKTEVVDEYGSWQFE